MKNIEYIQPISESSDNTFISKDIIDGTSITGSLNNVTSELDSEPEHTKLDDNLDNKIKNILNNELIETDFDTSLTELNGKYQEMFSNSDNKVKNDQKTEKLFKKFMDF